LKKKSPLLQQGKSLEKRLLFLLFYFVKLPAKKIPTVTINQGL
jgi:hypothetical protein